ncbi:MAG: hypothetical protein ABFS45_06850, partial [Pseudomonadota bacterium]
MKKILMNVHPNYIDQDAVEHIADFTSKTQSAIEVLHVIEDYPQDLHEWWNVRYPVRLYEEIVNKRQEFMDSIVERIKRAGVQNVTTKLRWGSELQEITREGTGSVQLPRNLLINRLKTEGQAFFWSLKACSH